MSPRRPPVIKQTAYVSPYPAMTSSISLNEAPREVRMEGTPILAIKKSMTPRNGPTRMTARAIHLLVGSRWERASGGVRRWFERVSDLGSNRFNESLAIPESEGRVGAAIDSFIWVRW